MLETILDPGCLRAKTEETKSNENYRLHFSQSSKGQRVHAQPYLPVIIRYGIPERDGCYGDYGWGIRPARPTVYAVEAELKAGLAAGRMPARSASFTRSTML